MFGKEIQLIMQQLQKVLTPRFFSQESLTTGKLGITARKSARGWHGDWGTTISCSSSLLELKHL